MNYLDNAATTKPNSEVLNTLSNLYNKYFLNAHSPYTPALELNEMQEQGRNKLAEILKVKSDELIYTSCGSESNNMAIKGIAYKHLKNNKKHIITSMIEHSSVYECIKQLEEDGFEVTYLKPQSDGSINNDDILDAIKDNTILISIMKVNSELGSINNVEDIYDDIKAINKDIIVHSDCVQALGKLDIDLGKLDLASFSAHKINGLKGSGLLYKKAKVNLKSLITGGSQEDNQRAGTSNYFFNILWTKTLRLYLEAKNIDSVNKRFEYAYNKLGDIESVHVNSSITNNSKFIINFSIPDYKSEVILNALELKDILLSTKSACSTNVKRSRVMDALPIDEKLKDSAFRISFDLDTSIEQIDSFIDSLNECLNQIKRG
ncbi:MAG: cysteine desulfurase family protein [Erysipelotrichales bacterium]